MPFDAKPAAPKVTTDAEVLLLRAKEVIRLPHRWTQGRLQRWTIFGRRYCVTGAVERAEKLFNLDAIGAARRALDKAAQARGFESASGFNDHPGTTHADALALLDEACAGGAIASDEPSYPQ